MSSLRIVMLLALSTSVRGRDSGQGLQPRRMTERLTPVETSLDRLELPPELQAHLPKIRREASNSSGLSLFLAPHSITQEVLVTSLFR